MRIIFTSILTLIIFIGMPHQQARSEMIRGYPDAIICDFSIGTFVGYLHGVLENGKASYFTMNNQSVTITEDKIIERPGASCHGKSLSRMREIGMAFDLYHIPDIEPAAGE